LIFNGGILTLRRAGESGSPSHPWHVQSLYREIEWAVGRGWCWIPVGKINKLLGPVWQRTRDCLFFFSHFHCRRLL